MTWISVKDELPFPHEAVMVVFCEQFIHPGYEFDGEDWYYYTEAQDNKEAILTFSESVTHWMRYPPIPKEDS